MKNQKILIFSSLLIGIALLVSACAVAPTGAMEEEDLMEEDLEQQEVSSPGTVEFTLVTGRTDSGLAFFWQGGDIDGQTNPVLAVSAGDSVRITLINGDGKPHDIFLPGLAAQSKLTISVDEEAVIEFTVSGSGEFIYFCTVDGHRAAGMEGKLLVKE